MAHRERTFRSSDGLDLFYRDYGDAGSERTPVVCLPGLTRNSRDFVAIAERLAPVRRVLCPDFRGRGYSARDPSPENYHAVQYAKDTFALLDDADVSRTAIIGTSLGGIVAMVMTHQDATRIAGVVMNDIGPELDPRGVTRIAQYVGAAHDVGDWDDAVAQCRASYEAALPGLADADWLAHTRAGWREGPNGIPQPDYDPEIRSAMQSGRGLVDDPWSLFDALVPIPTALLRGELSDLLTAEITEKMVARKPDLEVTVVPNRGHAPLLTEPAAVKAIEALLARLD
jgi:pimeloyl-ACP methyl ester carboxylesterase